MTALEFAHPERLWGLVGVLLILLLALPPRPQRELLTAYLPQWLRARARLRQPRIHYQWLRTLLAVLAYAAAIAAWSGPRRPAVPGPLRLVVLVDASASLAAAGAAANGAPAESAWTELRARLDAGLAALPLHVRAQTKLWRAAGVLNQVADLDRLRDLGAPARRGVGMDLARAAAGAAIDREAAVWTLSDGQGPVAEFGALTLCGAPAENAAIVALRVADRWPLPEVVVEVDLAAFSASAWRSELEVLGADQALDLRPPARSVELAPTPPGSVPAVVTERFELRRRQGGEVRVRLTAGGALAADDEVAFALPPPPAPRIAVASDSDAAVLGVAARILAEETGGEVVAAGEPDAKVSFVLVEGGTQYATAWANLPGMTFGTVLAPDTAAAAPAAAVVRDWRRDHVVTRGLDLSELAVHRLSATVAGEALVDGEDGPLLTTRARAVHAAFRLTDSNLWALPAFPQLLRRAYAAAHAELAQVRLAPTNLLDPAESDLRGRRAAERPLPAFGAPPLDLSAWFALAALLCLAARIFS